jgi:hypothetical protein
VVVTFGLTLTVEVLTPPALALHVYVVAVPPKSAVLVPEQIFKFPLTLIVGVAVTLTVTVLKTAQLPLAPLKVYVAVELGLTPTVLVLTPPALELQL